jgi:hypothetical protein
MRKQRCNFWPSVGVTFRDVGKRLESIEIGKKKPPFITKGFEYSRVGPTPTCSRIASSANVHASLCRVVAEDGGGGGMATLSSAARGATA